MGYFKNINLINFRNFEHSSLKFSKNCNVLFGKNGSGKTNILEAVSLLSKGRGLRKDKISNIIKKDKENFIIKSEFENEKVTYDLISQSKLINNSIKKTLSVNSDKSNESLNKIYELTPFLSFVPETERLFLSSPSSRRNFIDQLIFSYVTIYNKKVNEYNKFIQERSKILRNNVYDETWVSQIEKKISKYALEIYSLRERQINLIVENLNIYLIDYELPFRISVKLNDIFFSANVNQEFFEKELKNNRKIDSLLGGCKIGPHKSDYIFYTNNDFLVSQLSTGQQKTLILLIYLSQCKYLVKIKNKYPVLLFDEVCSHLDEINRNILLNLVETFNLQVFMTGTTKNLFSFLSTNTNFCNITY